MLEENISEVETLTQEGKICEVCALTFYSSLTGEPSPLGAPYVCAKCWSRLSGIDKPYHRKVPPFIEVNLPSYKD